MWTICQGNRLLTGWSNVQVTWIGQIEAFSYKFEMLCLLTQKLGLSSDRAGFVSNVAPKRIVWFARKTALWSQERFLVWITGISNVPAGRCLLVGYWFVALKCFTDILWNSQVFYIFAFGLPNFSASRGVLMIKLTKTARWFQLRQVFSVLLFMLLWHNFYHKFCRSYIFSFSQTN